MSCSIKKKILFLISLSFLMLPSLILILFPYAIKTQGLRLTDLVLIFIGFVYPLFFPIFRLFVYDDIFQKTLLGNSINILVGYILPAICLIVFSTLVFSKDSKFQKRLSALENRYFVKYVKPIESTPAIFSKSAMKVGKPLLVCVTNKNPDKNKGMWSSLSLYQYWERYIFPEELFNDFKKGKIQELPDFEPNFIIIIVEGTEASGRMIELDIGSVPEYRYYADIYILEILNHTVIGKSPRAYGKFATKPISRPGVHKYTELYGEPVSPKKIEAVINELLSGINAKNI